MPGARELKRQGVSGVSPCLGDSPEASRVMAWLVGSRRPGARQEGRGRERGCLCQPKHPFRPGIHSSIPEVEQGELPASTLVPRQHKAFGDASSSHLAHFNTVSLPV